MALPDDSAPAGCKKSFRVIIAGGGIGELAFSFAFQKIGINHVLLEKGEIASPWEQASLYGLKVLGSYSSSTA
jgi:2-polyprenyl-6-methoxyphenol hydroxylase-like FAD-dependent oxidoreductase